MAVFADAAREMLRFDFSSGLCAEDDFYTGCTDVPLFEASRDSPERVEPPKVEPPPDPTPPELVQNYENVSAAAPQPMFWKRYQKRICPHTAKSDRKLQEMVAVYGNQWKAISDALGGASMGFTVDAVRGRATRILNMYPEKSKQEKPKQVGVQREKTYHRWTEDEDRVLINLVMNANQVDHKSVSWLKASKVVKRTPHACRNRMMRLFPNYNWRSSASKETNRGSPVEPL